VEREVTIEELFELLKGQEGDFIIHLKLEEEADTNAEEE